MMAHDYECLLVAANLAVFTWDIIVKILQWKKFLEGQHYITFNGTKPTKDRVRNHMIRIGVLDDHSPSKIEMQKVSAGRIIVTSQQLNRPTIIQTFMEQ